MFWGAFSQASATTSRTNPIDIRGLSKYTQSITRSERDDLLAHGPDRERCRPGPDYTMFTMRTLKSPPSDFVLARFPSLGTDMTSNRSLVGSRSFSPDMASSPIVVVLGKGRPLLGAAVPPRTHSRASYLYTFTELAALVQTAPFHHAPPLSFPSESSHRHHTCLQHPYRNLPRPKLQRPFKSYHSAKRLSKRRMFTTQSPRPIRKLQAAWHRLGMYWYATPSHLHRDPSSCRSTATLFGNDNTTTCSSKVTGVAHIGTCYNTSWGRYRVDGCDRPGQVELRPISINTTATASAAPAATSAVSASHRSARIITGGLVGGLCACAVVAGIVYVVLLRRRRDVEVGQYSHEAPDASLTELSPGGTKLELYAQIVRSHELEVAPVELEWKVVWAAELDSGDVGRGKW